MNNILSIKVKEKGSSTGSIYKNHINLNDPSLLAMILRDLKNMFNAPIEKAIKLYNEPERDSIYPFSP